MVWKRKQTPAQLTIKLSSLIKQTTFIVAFFIPWQARVIK